MPVIEDRPHRNAAEGSPNAARRVRSWLGLPQDPALPRPRATRIEPIGRTWAAAFWQARVSVRAGVSLDDYLRSRLARYLAALPVPSARLPLAVDVDDGQITVQRVDPERRPPPGDGEDPWLAPLVAAEGPAVRQEVAELEIRLATLEGAAESARRRTEELQRRLAADVASGLVPAPSSVEATAEQLGRPAVRSGGTRAAALGFAAAAVLAETWQIALPMLRAAGLDPSRLAADARTQPAAVTFALVFALGVSSGLFALAHAGLEAAVRLFGGDDDPRRARWLAAAAGGATLTAAAVAGALAGLPAAVGAVAAPRATLALLLLAVPLATVLMLRALRAEAAARQAEADAALVWDRERARTLAERARRLEELAWAEAEEDDVEAVREATRRRLREINTRAMAAARLAEGAERRERSALARLARSLVGALELDRYEFVRQATARGAADLLAPRRRKPGEARPATSYAEPAPAPAPAAASAAVAAVAVGGGGVEAGHLAS